MAQPQLQWTPFPEVTSHWGTSEASKHNLYHQIEVSTSHLPNWEELLYKNAFDAARGVLLLQNNFRSLDTSPEPRPYLSDVLRHCYGAAEALVGGRAGRTDLTRAKPPRYVVVRHITNLQSMRVLRAAHDRRRVSPHIKQQYWPWSEEFVALMGTPNGKSLIHFLRDSCGFCGRRTIKNVQTVYAQDQRASIGGWWMMIGKVTWLPSGSSEPGG